MKTKTSKQVFWLRSLIILPLLTILIYGFSNKVTIKENTTLTQQTAKANRLNFQNKSLDIIKIKNKTQSKQKDNIKTGFININGSIIFFTEINDEKRYYNRWGNLVDKNGKKLNGNKQVNASNVIPGHYIPIVWKNNEIIVEFKNSHKNTHENNSQQIHI